MQQRDLRKQAVPFKLPTNITAWQNAVCNTKRYTKSPLSVIAFPNQRSVSSQNRTAKHFQNVRRIPIFQLINRKMRELHMTWCAGTKQMQWCQSSYSLCSTGCKQQCLHCHRLPLQCGYFVLQDKQKEARIQREMKKTNWLTNTVREDLMFLWW